MDLYLNSSSVIHFVEVLLTRDFVLLILGGVVVLGLLLLDSNQCKYPGGRGLRYVT